VTGNRLDGLLFQQSEGAEQQDRQGDAHRAQRDAAEPRERRRDRTSGAEGQGGQGQELEAVGRPPAAQPQVTPGACLVTTTKIHTKTMQFEVDAAALA